VLRDKSGTCVELAITYAAVCESAGIKCTLVLVPGHCFVVANLPSGNVLPVECTGISGPALEGFWESFTGKKHPDPFSFEEVVKVAGYEFSHREPGKSALIDVDAMQSQGVSCPELPKVAADIVNSWKVVDGQLVEHSVTYNKTHSRPITIQQDVLDVQDPVLGNIRWHRAN
jgi:hypothetical protein